MALNKLATDGVITGWTAGGKLEQTTERGNGKWGSNYGQVLKGGGRPSDQAEDGPALPANPQVAADARIDVYQAPNGFGWTAYFEAEEAGAIRWFRTVTVHENGPLVETDWALVPEEVPVPAP